MQCSLREYGRWTAGRVLCSALCGCGGFRMRKRVLSFQAPTSFRQRHRNAGLSPWCAIVVPAGVAASPSSSSKLEGPSQEEQKGKYISKKLLPPLVKHVKLSMDFPEDEVPDTSSGSLLHQFQSSVPVDVPIHPCIQEVIKREWRDADKILLRFMAKLYPLQDMAYVLLDLVPIDSFVASLVGRTSLGEDAVIRDSVDKNVDVSLKKAYAGTHLALRAGIYGTYFAQSLLSDLKALNSALDGSSDCSELMSLIVRQADFLLDISLDVVRALALAEGACVSAHRNLILWDWKTDTAQRASASWLPFQGNVVFGV
ncbi:hypothetical protein NDU88_002671 [Pleurodeles waltl]|uniref:Lamina-associated polypeptide 2 alpha C-terminal domain-containing protein n=1 Tax=Pleurodeles waltl TaxID=8319 RepID=A0AAV7UZ91_PLEWA|nr:hypothetical protein NDU88_002671 [Pleurodeles waltl]